MSLNPSFFNLTVSFPFLMAPVSLSPMFLTRMFQPSRPYTFPLPSIPQVSQKIPALVSRTYLSRSFCSFSLSLTELS